MAKVTLKGLNIRQSRNKWYVSRRSTGVTLIRGFVGSRRDLQRELESVEFLTEYSKDKTVLSKQVYQKNTFGELAEWYMTLPSWVEKKDRTKSDYKGIIEWLKTCPMDLGESDTCELQWVNIHDLRVKDFIKIRDYAYEKRKGRFSNYALSVLSSIFGQATDYGKVKKNRLTKVKRLYKASRSANRDWSDEEFRIVMERAPGNLRVVFAMARYIGMRGQSIFKADWNWYQRNAFGQKVMVFTAEKNDERVDEVCPAELIEILDNVDRSSTRISINGNNVPWKSINGLRKAVGEFIKKLRVEGVVQDGMTLHGLRTTFASRKKEELRRENRKIAEALGDRSEAMGAHYSRFAVHNIHNLPTKKNDK